MKLISISAHLAPANGIIFYYTGANNSVSVTWLMRPHASQPPLHTLKNVIISVSSPLWPHCSLLILWFVSAGCLGKHTLKPTMSFMWPMYWCLVWRTFPSRFAHLTEFPRVPDHIAVLPAMSQMKTGVIYCFSESCPVGYMSRKVISVTLFIVSYTHCLVMDGTLPKSLISRKMYPPFIVIQKYSSACMYCMV